jgi:hypothetical protein
MPVTILRILGAMAHQRYGSALAEFLQQSQRELLPVIFDRLVPCVNGPSLK